MSIPEPHKPARELTPHRGADVSTEGLWHYPAVITNSTIARSIASFAPDSSGALTAITTAAIINNFNGRQQMVWFLGFATDWSQTSNYLQHAHIHWMTRGLCTSPPPPSHSH